MRFRWTAAAGLTARAAVSAVVKNTTYTPFATQQSLWYNALVGGFWPSGSGVTDSFNRADNAASLGSTNTGQSWVALNGTWGIQSNQAYLSAAGVGENIAYVDTGKSDGTCSAIITLSVDAHWRMTARVIDAANFLVLVITASSLTLYRVTAGGGTQIAAVSSISVNVGDRLGIQMVGSSVSIVKNGSVMATATETQGQSSTKHGLEADALGASHWDDFSFV
jgi:hypothetical protein